MENKQNTSNPEDQKPGIIPRSLKSKRKSKFRHVPYATGFRPPGLIAKVMAIGCEPMPSHYDPFSSDREFFKPIPNPTNIDDWLAQYAEEGQTYRDFLKECPWLSSRRCKGMSKQKFIPSGQSLPQKYPDGKIYLVPIGNFGSDDSLYFDDLIDYATRFLCLPVMALPPIKLVVEKGAVYWIDEPDDLNVGKRKSLRVKRCKLTSRYNPKTKHIQLCVDSNLLQLRKQIPDDAICMVGLTMFDLYGDQTDLFVAGMAAGNHHVGVFSFYRYDPSVTFGTEFWYDVKRSNVNSAQERRRIILERSCKLLVHELCHLLGLAHCIHFDCCMNGSGHLSEDFRQPMFLCPVDLHKLQTLMDCDVVTRYENLLQFYIKHGMTKETEWVTRRIEFINRNTSTSSDIQLQE